MTTLYRCAGCGEIQSDGLLCADCQAAVRFWRSGWWGRARILLGLEKTEERRIGSCMEARGRCASLRRLRGGVAERSEGGNYQAQAEL